MTYHHETESPYFFCPPETRFTPNNERARNGARNPPARTDGFGSAAYACDGSRSIPGRLRRWAVSYGDYLLCCGEKIDVDSPCSGGTNSSKILDPRRTFDGPDGRDAQAQARFPKLEASAGSRTSVHIDRSRFAGDTSVGVFSSKQLQSRTHRTVTVYCIDTSHSHFHSVQVGVCIFLRSVIPFRRFKHDIDNE